MSAPIPVDVMEEANAVMAGRGARGKCLSEPETDDKFYTDDTLYETDDETQARRERNALAVLVHFANLGVPGGAKPFASDRGIQDIIAAVQATGPLKEYLVLMEREKLDKVDDGWYTAESEDLYDDLGGWANMYPNEEFRWIPQVFWLDVEFPERAVYPVLITVACDFEWEYEDPCGPKLLDKPAE